MPTGVKFQKTEEQGQMIAQMAQYGLTQEQIAKICQIGLNTLKRHYEEEYQYGFALGGMAVAKNLQQIAANGKNAAAVTAAMFFLKTKCGFKETHFVEIEDNRDEERASALAAADAKIEELLAKKAPDIEDLKKMAVQGNA